MLSVPVRSHMEGFSWIMIFGRKSHYFWFFYFNLTKQKLLLGIRSSWIGKVGENCSSVSGMRLRMSSKRVFQVSLMSMRTFLVNKIRGKTAEEQRISWVIFSVPGKASGLRC